MTKEGGAVRAPCPYTLTVAKMGTSPRAAAGKPTMMRTGRVEWACAHAKRAGQGFAVHCAPAGGLNRYEPAAPSISASCSGRCRASTRGRRDGQEALGEASRNEKKRR